MKSALVIFGIFFFFLLEKKVLLKKKKKSTGSSTNGKPHKVMNHKSLHELRLVANSKTHYNLTICSLPPSTALITHSTVYCNKDKTQSFFLTH